MATARDEDAAHEALRRQNLVLSIDFEIEAKRSAALRRLFLGDGLRAATRRDVPDVGEPAHEASEPGNSVQRAEGGEHLAATPSRNRDVTGAESGPSVCIAPSEPAEVVLAADTARRSPTPPTPLFVNAPPQTLVDMRDAIPKFRLGPFQMRQVVSVNPGRSRIQGGISLNTSAHPFAPAHSGHGALYFSLKSPQVDGRMDVYVGTRDGTYVYRGRYESVEVRKMSIAEWQALPAWCKAWWLEIFRLSQSKEIANIRARILARKQLGREPTTVEIGKLFPGLIPRNGRAHIHEAFNSGEVALHVIALKCVGYEAANSSQPRKRKRTDDDIDESVSD
ncbi:hypothetical protein FA95DRAFT_1603941 [Auriscalpium vulgare]|uniref:Uncharacterized protein n=1 Tax=Auriscalpium vulgare TaxID=40419 RepID=A0ACB8S1E0_9AGAM|nr:hypothetical protein FA95DRAFT_1603941 [Auriscalpium vulgare]